MARPGRPERPCPLNTMASPDLASQQIGKGMTIQTAPPGAAPPGSAEAADQADHITPWQNCYCSTQLLGGESRFVLSTSGHIAALVNPSGSPKASYQAAKTNPAGPADWLKTAQSEQGSWWPDLLAWRGDRCGADKPAPAEPGGGLRPLAAAPGTYVFDN